MKKHIIVLSAALMLLGCATSAEKLAQQQKTANAVIEAMSGRHYKIDVESAYPSRGKMLSLSWGFSLEIKGDTIISNLPYYGRAYSIPYGGGKGLNFTSTIQSYTSSEVKMGKSRVVIKTRNEEDSYQYTLEVFPNGEATIDVISRERETISFRGRLRI